MGWIPPDRSQHQIYIHTESLREMSVWIDKVGAWWTDHRDFEDSNQFVAYTEGGKRWCRPLQMFLGNANVDGQEVSRFLCQI